MVSILYLKKLASLSIISNENSTAFNISSIFSNIPLSKSYLYLRSFLNSPFPIPVRSYPTPSAAGDQSVRHVLSMFPLLETPGTSSSQLFLCQLFVYSIGISSSGGKNFPWCTQKAGQSSLSNLHGVFEWVCICVCVEGCYYCLFWRFSMCIIVSVSVALSIIFINIYSQN